MKSTTFMQTAFLIAQESKCSSWKVGVVIEKNGRIISTGYNGSVSGLTNCCDHCVDQGWAERVDGTVKLYKDKRQEHSAWSLNNEVHAEMNAILFAARNGTSTEGSTLYTTLAPCYNCAKAIAQSGVRTVVYAEDYDMNSTEWSKVLVDAGVKVHKLDKKHLKFLRWEEIKSKPEFIE